MSDKEITTALYLINQRQARLASACKEIADWIDRQGDVPVAGKIRDTLKAVEADDQLVRKTLTSLSVERPLPRFR
ncbi:hypothetical protein HFV04_024375 [Pseudomonas sp. BIGb0427]|uniref:hypothetical protein n=1 Tax=unclassified Pseudomonas TaxID=196821 RepID=UPI0016ADBC83|nr:MULTISPECIES: hypothetical protein [unclassified Pseudomonas]NLU59039.1 hypothetical protein [Pseudomonas sp. BIGb0427]QPG62620.1 hypothetical protein HFV04_024375 [Pseudomonas sp. BIGb0427]UVM64966.1 hypothetical protein LOY34_16660 [Pseudomonas sp. B21-009]